MSFSTIACETSAGILTITLNRPDRLNAFTLVMASGLVEASSRRTPTTRCARSLSPAPGALSAPAPIFSAGGAAFDRAARGDLPTLPDGAPDLSDEAARDAGGRVTLRIFASLKPVIAAVNGPAVGIGVTMLLPMDIRIASTDARFGFVFVRRGIVSEACSRLVPAAHRRHRQGARLELLRTRFPGRGGAGRRARERRSSACRTPSRGAGDRARDRRQHGAGCGGADPPDDVGDARGRPSDGGPQD